MTKENPGTESAQSSTPSAQPQPDPAEFVITRVFDAPRDLMFKA